jgi:ketosteroid isomerase-like protein
MTERSPASTATAFLEAFGSGDLDATLALLHDNVIVDVPGDPPVPWSGRRHGHAGAAEFFGLLGEHLEPEAFEIDKVLGDDETAVAQGRFRQRVRRSGDSFASEFALRLQVADGRIVTYLMVQNSWAVADVFGAAVAASS